MRLVLLGRLWAFWTVCSCLIILTSLCLLGYIFSIPKIEGLKVMGQPDMSVICFGSTDKKVDVFKVAEAMGNRHWNLNSLQNPSWYGCLFSLFFHFGFA